MEPVSTDDLIEAVDRITDGGTRLGLDAWDDVTAWLAIELPQPTLWGNEALAEMILVALRGSELPFVI